MDYEHSYRSGENHIYIEEWEGKEVANMPEYYFEMPGNTGEYVYEMEVGATWDDMFGELIVRKALAEDLDQLFKLEKEEVDIIVDAIAKSNIFDKEI